MAKKILIVDDEPGIRETVIEFLNESGYYALGAADGSQGLDMIEKENPQLVLLDMRMPGKSGIDVLKEINQRFPNVIVIVMSGMKEVETAKEAIRLGACDYITKPISLEMLTNDYIKRNLGN